MLFFIETVFRHHKDAHSLQRLHKAPNLGGGGQSTLKIMKNQNLNFQGGNQVRFLDLGN